MPSEELMSKLPKETQEAIKKSTERVILTNKEARQIRNDVFDNFKV